MRGSLLFYRDFQGLSGGHLKVWDYYCHAKHSDRYEPRIALSRSSLAVDSNPWIQASPASVESWDLRSLSALFLGGLDWAVFPKQLPCPVINLIQGVRHASRWDPRRRFLSRRAIRICVSDEVAHAIQATGLVNGPIVTIPCGLNLDSLPPPLPASERDIRLLIVGVKNPAIAHSVAQRLTRDGYSSQLVVEHLPRSQFLSLVGRAHLAVLLPEKLEGFFLPALEAMALGTMVVCPDCVGNRGFCRDRETCFRPAYSVDGIVRSTIDALDMLQPEADEMLLNARRMVEQHTLEMERDRFLTLLDQLPHRL